MLQTRSNTALNSLPLLSLNSKGKVISASELWMQTFGIVPDERINGKDVWSLLEEVDSAPQNYFAEMISKGVAFDMICSFSLNEELRSAQVQVFPVMEDGERTYLSVWMLLEPSRAIQLEISRILGSISERLEEGFYRTTLGGDVIYMNDAMHRMLGYQKGVGQMQISAKDFYADPNRRENLMLELAQSGKFSNQEVLLRRTDGEIFWGLMSTSQSIQEDGEVLLDGSVRDISKIKEIEKQLTIEMKRAEAASHAKQQFLSVISHELKTPLNGVIGLCHLLQEAEPRPDQKDHLNALQFSAESLLHLINDVLDFSKIEAEGIQLSKEWFDLREFLGKTVELFNQQPTKKDINLQLIVAEEAPSRVYLDAYRLTQIMNNLLSNALKFTFHGEVVVKVDVLEKDDQSCALRFSVSDTGIGIPQSKLKSIFQLFTQASSSTTRKFGGTGLGLSITKGLIELFGSELKVESELGVGTTFFFDVQTPTKKEASVAIPPLEEEQQMGREMLQGKHILAVEDNEVNQLLLKRYLKDLGMEVSVASNGLEALTMAEVGRFDAILMDIQMPGMDGYAATRQLRKMDSVNANAPVIAVTASMMSEIQDKCIDAGMDAILLKPYAPEDLSKILKKYL